MIANRSVFSTVIGLFGCLLLTGCISKSPYQFVPVDATGSMPSLDQFTAVDMSPKTELPLGARVLVAPVNHLDVDLDYLVPYYEQVSYTVEKYVNAQGGELVETELFVDVWREVTNVRPEWYQASHEQFDQDKYNVALVKTIELVAQRAGVDVFVFPGITETQVIVSRSTGVWAGVKRTVEIEHTHPDRRHLRMAHNNFVWTGEMVGLNLTIDVVDARGVVLYQGVGGIGFRDEVLAKPKDGKHYSYERVAELRTKENPIGDAGQLTESIGVALHSYLPVRNTVETTAQVDLPQ